MNRLLTCKRISIGLDEGKIIGISSCSRPGVKIAPLTKQELAKKLGISQEELEKLKSFRFYSHVASRITLPLIRLYCSTKFEEDEYKSE